ncbi:MAG: HlyC/CorC family transporter [Armatimonadetes bacterium]|nr:HlyC/CorC family transporter [Armatimonadota bacterium]
MMPSGAFNLTLASLLVCGLILLNAFFAMAELALITVRRTRVRQLAEEGNRSALRIEQLLAHPTRFMATIQTGVTLVATLSPAIAATAFVAPLNVWFQQRHLFGAAGSTISLLVVTIPVAVVTLVVGEIAPKSLAVRHAERIALVAVGPVLRLQALFTPAVAVLTYLGNVAVRPFGGTATFSSSVVNEAELKMMVEAGEEQGVLQSGETEMIHSVLDLSDTVVRKVMTQRLDIAAIPSTANMKELLDIIRESGHSRIPVYAEDLDNIVGTLHAKDLLAIPPESGPDAFQSAIREPWFIPETLKVDMLLAEMRRKRQHIAIVRDEYGVTVGLVTIEDLVEEIVGEITDEYDSDEDPPKAERRADGALLLDGLMQIDEVNEVADLQLPEDEADTIGGFVFGLLGHQPEKGEHAAWNDCRFTVESTDGRRITSVLLVRTPPPHSDDNGNSDAAAVEPEVPQADGDQAGPDSGSST